MRNVIAAGLLSFGGAAPASAVTFTQANETSFPGFPFFLFRDGDLTSIDYLLEGGVNGADLVQFGLSFVSWDSDLFFNANDNRFELTASVDEIAPVPLPASLPLLAGAFGLMAFVRRHRS